MCVFVHQRFTALFAACWHGKLEAAQWLVEHGANLFNRDHVRVHLPVYNTIHGLHEFGMRDSLGAVAGGIYRTSLCSGQLSHCRHGMARACWDQPA